MLVSYLPSFAALTALAGIYTGIVFYNQSYPNQISGQNQSQNQSQNFNVAKKLSAEKVSTDVVAPVRDVASPLETE